MGIGWLIDTTLHIKIFSPCGEIERILKQKAYCTQTTCIFHSVCCELQHHRIIGSPFSRYSRSPPKPTDHAGISQPVLLASSKGAHVKLRVGS